MAQTTYINGDKCEYTGTSEQLHGGTFFHVRMIEGRHAGKVKVTQRTPAGVNPHQEARAREHVEMQAGFSRLHS